MELINKLQLAGRVEEFNETWRGDKDAWFSVRILANEYDGKQYFAIFKATENVLNVQGFGVGAEIEATGGLQARQGKDGRWWSDAMVRSIKVIKAAPEAPKPVTLEDDEIPF
jgi:hypothetical protein